MNIEMQCCGLILLLVVFFFYHRQKKIYLTTEKAFVRIFLVITIGLTLDILSLAALKYMDRLPELLVDLTCKAYLATLILTALNGIFYVTADIYDNSPGYRKRTFIYCTLAVIGILLVLFTPIYKNVENPDTLYTDGPSVLITYAFCMLFFVVMLVLVIREKHQMNPKRREAVIAWLLLWVAASMIQFLNNNRILLVGYSGAIAVMIIYLKLENPETNLDRQTGLFNQNALIQYINQLFSMKMDFSLLVVCLPSSLVRSNPEADRRVRIEIVRYISSLPNCLVFKGTENEILLLLQDTDQLEQLAEQLEERFNSGWGHNQEIQIRPDWMMIPHGSVMNRAEDILFCLQYARQNSIEFAESGSVILDQDFASRMYEEWLVEHLLDDAIKNDWIDVYYQPIYSIREKRFVSAEALSRIIDGEGTVYTPDVFIPIAEKNGMILKFGELVFKKVCQFISNHHPENRGIHYIEVNLSVVQCSYEHLADSFIEIMEWYHIDPSMINLEITESGSVGTRKTLLDNMQKLIDYGVRFSLDDFGTGHSNLNYIVDMPVDIVKFDRSMIVSYFDNGKAKYVMDAAMHMIHGMDLQIVSEGIETKEQLDTMEDLGISYIQGYYFSRPISSDAFLSFLDKNYAEIPEELENGIG